MLRLLHWIFLYSIVLCIPFSKLGAQNKTLVISEFMSANGSIIADEFGEFDDWIELHNYGNVSIDLKGILISDNLEKRNKFEIKDNLTIEPGGYLLFWADASPYEGKHHLNFKLSEGESIVISENGKIIDSVLIENQRPDISYGKLLNDHSYGYFAVPTPMETNKTKSFKFLSSIISTHNTGIYSNSIEVGLSQIDQANIFYTLDGSEPTIQSKKYNDIPIVISTNTTLRAIAYKENHLLTEIKTCTFVFDEPSTIPTLYVTSNGHIINGKERIKVHLEYVDTNGNNLFSEVVSSKLHGGDNQLSFKCFFGANHGGRKINVQLFDDKPEVKEIEALVFRQAGNDGLNTSSAKRSHMRDGFISSIVNRGDFNFKASGFKQVNVFLDGRYHGVFNMRERVDKSFIRNNYDVDEEKKKCFIEYKFNVPRNINEIEGKWAYYDSLVWSRFYETDLSNDNAFIEATQFLNIDDFTDYWMHQIFIGNYDWLTNNVYFWSPISDNGKFRWILWDTDVGIGLNGKPDWNSLDWATGVEDGRPLNGKRTAIIRGLLTNKNYRDFFITRFCDLLNTEYLPSSTLMIFNDLASNVKNEIPKHINRWNKGSFEAWEKELAAIREYITKRPKHVREHIKSKFLNIDSSYKLDIKTLIPNAGSFKINTVDISTANLPWNGTYFNGLPLSITVKENDGYRFVGWKHISDLNNSIELSPTSDTSIVALFEAVNNSNYSVVINEISYTQIDGFDSGDWVELYNDSELEIDISDWTFVDSSNGKDPYVFPAGSKVGPNEYIVIVKDKNKFNKVFPEMDIEFHGLDFGLSKKGEEIKLYDAFGNLVDRVNYKANLPWPVLKKSNSIELTDFTMDNNMGSSWQSSGYLKGSPGGPN